MSSSSLDREGSLLVVVCNDLPGVWGQGSEIKEWRLGDHVPDNSDSEAHQGHHPQTVHDHARVLAFLQQQWVLLFFAHVVIANGASVCLSVCLSDKLVSHV